jgi:hypothetical protein
VLIEAAADGLETTLTVSDSGPGIPQADIPKIFDRFYRSGSPDRVASGSGLGLAAPRPKPEHKCFEKSDAAATPGFAGHLHRSAMCLDNPPHDRWTWSHDMGYAANQYAAIVIFHFIGVSVGLLSSAQRRMTARYRDAAAGVVECSRAVERLCV